MSCPNCPSDIRKYGFSLIVGKNYYTSVSEKSCCPERVKLLDYNASTVTYQNEKGVTKEKSYLDFMHSSWMDRLPE